MDKKLIGEVSNRCLSTTDTTPKSRSVLDNQINTCNNGTGQTVKCEFYCPDGWHKETDGNCYQNSYRYEPEESSRVTGNVYVTYTPKCLLAGESDTQTKTARSADGWGTWTFTRTFSNPT